MSAVSAKTEFINHFYQFTSDLDWQTGLELYQTGAITHLATVESLVVGKVRDDELFQDMEVRIKMHASRRFIQWLECTCADNRMRGHFCRHIIAVIFHLDREKHRIVQDLDLEMLIRPTGQVRKRVPTAAVSVQRSVLSHLRGSISQTKLHTDGRMTVDVEIKKGKAATYDLDVDQAAEFAASTEGVRVSTCHEYSATRAIYLCQDAHESLFWQRVLTLEAAHGCQLPSRTTPALRRATVCNRGEQTETTIDYLVATQVEARLGTRYLFLSGCGYVPVAEDSSWGGLPNTKRYLGDQAAALIQSDFEELRSCSHLLIDSALQNETIVEDPKKTRIEVKDMQDGAFHLSLSYHDGDVAIPLTKLLTRNKKRRYLKTHDKHWLKVPALLTEMDWQTDSTGELIVASALDIHRLRAALGDYDSFVGSKKLLGRLSARTAFDEMLEPPPLTHTNLQLRTYQHFGFKWLWWLYRNNLHGLLADEMGLGKTHQTMALLAAIQRDKQNFRFLVVCPTTVLTHWQEKISDFAPSLQPMIYHGQSRAASLPHIVRGNTTVITSYGVLQRDVLELQKSHWDVVVLDEAHYVKNSSTNTYRAACRLPNAMRICLSGTPFENDLRELKSIFDFLLPGYLGSDRFFNKNILRPLKTNDNLGDEMVLKRLIHPFKLRRTKEAVLPDLPDKIIDFRSCTLSALQKKLYQSVIEFKARPLSEQLEKEASDVQVVHIFAILNLLKQICNHPLLVLDGLDLDKHESGKFELMKELIFEGLESNQKIVIYTQYLKMVDIISAYLNQQKIKFVSMTGASRQRGKIIAQFQEDEETRVFVATLLTGGIGIDLTAASIVIHYDRWWNASKENQATDRVHRIGQQKNVQVFKLITKDTFEEKIDRLIHKKQDLFEKYLEKDEEIFKNLTRQELIELLR